MHRRPSAASPARFGLCAHRVLADNGERSRRSVRLNSREEYVMRRFLVFALLLSTLALAACDAPAPTAPCTVTVSKQAADQFLQRARQTLVPGRPVTLTANNQEVTSLFSQLLEQSRTQNPSDVVPLENPVV